MNEFSLLREHNLPFFPRLSRIKIKFPGKINRLPPKIEGQSKNSFSPSAGGGKIFNFPEELVKLQAGPRISPKRS